MLFDYIFFTSLILGAVSLIFLANTYRIGNKAQKTGPTKAYESQRRIRIQIQILYFFVISIVLTRLAFCVLFPIQIDSDFGVGFSIQGFSFFLAEVFIFFGYLLLFLLLMTFGQIKQEQKWPYLAQLLKRSSWLIVLEVIMSLLLYFWANFSLITKSIELKNFPLLPLKSITFMVIVLLLFSAFIMIYWLLRNRQEVYKHLVLASIALVLAIVIAFFSEAQFRVLFSGSGMFAVFSYPQFFYGWFWLLLIAGTLGTQIAAAILLRLKSNLHNRYFALNNSLQFNRVSLVCMTGLTLVTLFPQFLIYLFKG